MKESKVKRLIYLRTFVGFLAIYLVLMAGFSIFHLTQEKKVESLALQAFADRANGNIGWLLQELMDNQNQVRDISEIKKELIGYSSLFTDNETEVAIFTGDYELIFNTNDYWQVSFTKYSEGKKSYTGYAYLNPKEWFSEEEIQELENFLHAFPEPKQVGDLAGYSISLKGFWLDKEMIIPDRIEIIPMLATKFDDHGRLITASGDYSKEIIYVANAKNTEGLPYFEHGRIHTPNRVYPRSEKRVHLRNLAFDKEELIKTVEELQKDIAQASIGVVTWERANLLTYRYRMVLPYRNSIRKIDDHNYYSESWSIFAREVNLWEKNAGTLAFVWLSCLVTFLIVAFILSAQTYQTYRKREELERHRREMTHALAHDLKTPLSIISGYAQNLMENVHTDKRGRYAANIRDKVDYMDRIIREMLDLSRLESTARQFAYRTVSLGEVCQEIIERYKDICKERNIKIQLEGEQILRADGALIERVIDNFFTNALEHTPDGGTIRMKISEHTFEIYNSGSHIPEEKLQNIWQPYCKADEARSRARGTGLGLAIAGRILEAHQFTYGAKNSGDGVIFWFKFT